jgi:hypothetical protein
MIRFLTISIVTASLLACSTKPIEISSGAVQDLKVKSAELSACAFRVEFADKRSNQDNLGNVGVRGFVYKDFSSWFMRQVERRLRTSDAAGSDPTLRVELLQAYLESNRSTLSFNVVLKSTLPGEDAIIVRGDTTKVNWIGNDGELGAYVERASDRALDKLTIALKPKCKAAS